MLDIAVAGGGPAGLATAILAARAGREVTVFEPREGVIDKACGEGLMPGAVTALHAMGVKPDVTHPFVGIRYVDGARMAEGRFAQGPGLGVRRTTLHRALRSRAEALGVAFRAARVDEVQPAHDHVQLCGERARWLIAADGLYSPIRRGLGLERPNRRRKRMGLRRHFAQAPWSPFVEVYWSPDAEAYVTPVGPRQVGVAMLFAGEPLPEGRGAEGRFATLLQRFPVLAERLVGDPCTAVRGRGPFERRAKRRQVGRVLFVGDASGYLDPITGEGIRLGIATAEAAVACIADARADRYERRWRAATWRYWTLTEGLLSLRDVPALRRLMVPFLRTVPGAFSTIVSLLAD
ncbi:MAG: NAD(P)/FAD-dependent oxidoreductase [Myxococcota bacterium]